jgi:hypothetical protein
MRLEGRPINQRRFLPVYNPSRTFGDVSLSSYLRIVGQVGGRSKDIRPLCSASIRFLLAWRRSCHVSETSLARRAAAGTINCRGNPLKPNIKPWRGDAER